MKFLIDECLSPELVNIAHALGHEAYHVAHRGWSGWADADIRDRLVADELVLVTNNRDDFLALLGAEELHPGLVVLLENVRRSEQVRLFSICVTTLSQMISTINKVLEIDASGETRVYDLPNS